MCKTTHTFTRLSVAAFLFAAQAAYATQDPPGCTGSGGQITLQAYACSGATVDTCTTPIVGTGPVISGQLIAYQAVVSYPGGNVCAFQGGAITITTPNGATVNATPAAGIPCLGCTVHAGGVPSVSSNKVLYTVNCAQATAGAIVASTNYTDLAGAAPVTLHSGTTEPNNLGPKLSTSLSLLCVSCSASIDKQVSCDGGATWQDVTSGGDDSAGNTTRGCVARVGTPVQIRFVARNTGGAPISCTLADNVLTIPAGSQTISLATPNATSTVTLNPLTCNLTGSQSGTNTATLANCACPVTGGGTVPGTGGTDTATYSCCGAQIDKQVSCNSGTTFADVGFADGAIGGCEGVVGQSTLRIQYVARNTGNVPVSCSMVDANSAGNLFTVAAGGISIAAGATNAPLVNNSTNQGLPACSLDLNSAEPNTATLNCSCTAPGMNALTVSDTDTARITCSGTPAFNVTKECIPVTGVHGRFTTAVHLNNTGNVPISCNVTDRIFAGACPPTGTGTVVPLTPGNPVSVPVTPTPTNLTGTVDVTATSCNQATAVCTFGSTTLPTQTATAVCPVGEGCFTRTPGYWGTHPTQTQQVIGAGLPVCGITLTSTNAGVFNSATEDVCMSGVDAQKANTSMQQLQLIRQCTAAALNLRVSTDRRSTFDCESELPGITARFQSCCTAATSTCNTAKTGQQIAASGCIEYLDAFNNRFDSTEFPSWLPNSSADPTQCQIATGNGFVNPGRNLGPR